MKVASPIPQLAAFPSAERRQRGPHISIIIPALNEASAIEKTLRHIPLMCKDIEVIVVDGGSRDPTVKIARDAGARVICTSAGRAHQMNAGAAAARGEVLLFLHADTRLPVGFVNLMDRTLRRPGVVLGAFRLRIGSPRWGLRIVEIFANLRSRWLRLPYGDQALFLRRRHFRTAVGFSELPIMEDFEFVRRLGRWGRIALAPAAVETSARRWERLGVLRTALLNQAIILAYLLGLAPARLARWYHGGTLSLESISRETDKPEAPAFLAHTRPSANER